MVVDIFLAIGLVVTQALLAFLGFRVTLRPPNARLHPHYKVAFGGLALAGVILVIVATVRNSEIQTGLNNKLDVIKGSIDKLSISPSNSSPTPKLLSASEVQSVTDALKSFADKSVKLSIGCTISAVYPCQSAEQWLSIFKNAGWNPSDPILSHMYMPPFAGVHIAVLAQDVGGAGVIQQAFKSMGIDARGEVDPSLSADQILIKFGLER